MDKVIAKRMADELQGKVIGGWTIGEKLGEGKSALVMRAKRCGEEGAVKVFDRELVQKFGAEAQKQRGDRERSLVGRDHPNLIKILDAGYDDVENLFFVVMELFPGKNLADVLKDVPVGQEHALIAQVASAAQFLESLKLAHRDIKPENIGVSDDFQRAVLLDLGVLRPLDGYISITDHGDQKNFVGTLQYSPPEMLYRVEESTMDAWRAITFYQLGAVLYDLLTRRPLFADFIHPFARLVKAVDEEVVMNIPASSAAPDLRMLAQDCLVKDWETRLRLITWDRFQKPPAARGDLTAAKQRIEMRRRRAAVPPKKRVELSEGEALRALANRIDGEMRDASQAASAPPVKIGRYYKGPVAFIRVGYKASSDHAVTWPFVIYVECEIADVASRVISVRGAAVIASVELPREPLPEWLTTVFEAVDDQDSLRAALDRFVLLAYDAASEACEMSQVTEAPLRLHPSQGAV